MNRLHGNKAQFLKAAGSVIILAMALIAFQWALEGYLSALAAPGLLEVGFWLSLGVAAYGQRLPGHRRVTLIRIAATTATASLGVVFAHVVRDWYVGMLAEIPDTPEAVSVLGADLVAAFHNRVVGYGGCYALGMMATRWLLYRHVLGAFTSWVAPPPEVNAHCSHCGQPMPSVER
ncbi:hypothetical protein [Ralstonia sp. ASV6]|uniref:hypothetical protein n=1 Tax=Ralstonia sp. ASV6 TaxID=2795124 RepID=UPI0018ECE8BE|nr:hypothetical protein [Ralstonia sp. ASV6]